MQQGFSQQRKTIHLLKTLCGRYNLQIQEFGNSGVCFIALGIADVLLHFEVGSYIPSTVSMATDFSQKVRERLALILMGFEDKY